MVIDAVTVFCAYVLIMCDVGPYTPHVRRACALWCVQRAAGYRAAWSGVCGGLFVCQAMLNV